MIEFLHQGGPVLWGIAGLSVITLTLIIWKLWRLLLCGAWAGGGAERAVALWQAGQADAAQQAVAGRAGMRARLVRAAVTARQTRPEAKAREETTRVARALLAEARTGLRALEVIATVAPLLGLLGTVLGMIEAFRVLEASGARADPSALAGGIWEALLTTAAGMAVAIPAALALSWFESVIDRAGHEMEDLATRIFLGGEA
ncbi:outer membrane transport energization protein ExbB [Rhodovulum imhoffii]|uniref:Outer membrane transport energization protein ExbB n=2 Tax=Rhodovulum imhoffii TaxID=365340 RepID=A0A2T5BWR7_9RHOB|nr:MotA/TolQ/ExbB proton channel family protein [Rhodovulum imhoffii]PTN04030.1 outer membrane transport energization protein ExbB [Rhodovulum imhoffii]